MSAETPEPGDVWLHEETGEPVVVYEHAEGGQYGSSTIAESVFLFQRAGVEAGVRWSVPVSGLREKARFTGVNVFALLAGDPSAWAAALRFLPAPFLLEVEEGEEKREVVGLPRGARLGRCCLRAERREVWLTERNGKWLTSYLRYGVDDEPQYLPDAEDFPTAVNAALRGDEDAT